MNIEQNVLILLVDTNLGISGTIEYNFSSTTTKPTPKDSEVQSTNESSYLHFKEILQAICYLIRSYELMSDSKRVVVIAMNSKKCGIVYEGYTQNYFYELTNPKRFNELEDQILGYIDADQSNSTSSMLATSFSISLCYMNRIQKESSQAHGQILIIDASEAEAYSTQYIPLMNASFTASKHEIIVDVCSLRPHPSSILQQLVDITGGSHINFSKALQTPSKLNNSIALSEFLLFHFLPSKPLRRVIATIKHQDKANTAVCFCHHKTVEICIVCSCCLAIYCSEIDEATGKERTQCKVCKARFTRLTIQQKVTSDYLF